MRSKTKLQAKSAIKQETPANQTTAIRLDLISQDESLMTRANLCSETIANYAAAMEEGAKFPPLDVFDVRGDGYLLADGWHRNKAALMVGYEHIEVNIHKGSREDALSFALKANHQHGLRRTNADKRRAVEIAVKMWSNMSSRSVADLCGVHHDLVELVRKERDQLADSASSTKRVGKDGKERPAYSPRPPDPEREEAEKDKAESADTDRSNRTDYSVMREFESYANDARTAIADMELCTLTGKDHDKAAAICRKLIERLERLESTHSA